MQNLLTGGIWPIMYLYVKFAGINQKQAFVRNAYPRGIILVVEVIFGTITLFGGIYGMFFHDRLCKK